MNYRACWLTLNRACNLRCKWCYAASTGFSAKDDMPPELAKQIIDICVDLKITKIILIGGEPTVYPHLFDIIDYCHSRGIRCGIVTNGLACERFDFAKKLKEHGISSLSVSLKGENTEVFKDITGVDAFERTKQAITNCLNNGISVGISMVLTEDNIRSYLDGVKEMKALGVDRFHFSFCYEFDISMDHSRYLRKHNPRKLALSFMNSFPELDRITGHHFTFQNGLPLCAFEDSEVETLKNSKNVSTICQLLAKNGLLFDPKGYLIPCNAMHEVKLGQLNKDFSNSSELLEFVGTDEIKKTYAKLCGVPDVECLSCKKLSFCGGGCVCQWTNYNYKEFRESLAKETTAKNN